MASFLLLSPAAMAIPPSYSYFDAGYLDLNQDDPTNIEDTDGYFAGVGSGGTTAPRRPASSAALLHANCTWPRRSYMFG